MKKIIFFLLFLPILIFSSCSQQSPTEVQQNNDPAYPISDGYPATNLENELNDSYPVDNSIQYGDRGPDFNINEPLTEGEQTVSGTGPAGVPIILVDVFMNGEFLDETTIQENGEFIFNLVDPLVKGHSIGIMLGDISGSDFNEIDFIYNENYRDIPLIGVIFDMVVVY
jgi:hypothetical protein